MAFGRPFLRRTARPAIQIPSRKRQRIAYEKIEDDGSAGQVDDRQMVIRAGIRDPDELSSEDDDDDFEPGDEEGLGGELEALRADSEKRETVHDVVEARSNARTRTRSHKSPQGLGLLALHDKDCQIISDAYSNPLLDEYSQDPPLHLASALKVPNRDQRRGHQYSMRGTANKLQDSSKTPEPVGRRDSNSSNKSVRFEDQEDATPATVRVSEETDGEDDGDFEPNKLYESDKENAPPRSQSGKLLDEVDDATDTSSASFSNFHPSDSDETSSSGSSSSSNSDSEPEELPAICSASDQDIFDTTSNSTSSSDVESDSEAEHSPKKSDITPNTSIEDTDPTPSKSWQRMNPPGTGRRKTRMRNLRRRQSNNLKKLISKGDLPSNATYKDLHSFREARNSKSGRNVGQQQGSQQNAESAASGFEAKRQALFDSIASSGVEISQPKVLEGRASTGQTLVGDEPSGVVALQSDSPTHAVDIQKQNGSDSPVVQVQDSLKTPAMIKSATKEVTVKMTHSHESSVEQVPPSGKSDAVKMPDLVKSSSKQTSDSAGLQQRRLRLDLASSKRLLFGSLGLKTPKTKEDASSLQAKLSKDTRPAQQSKAEPPAGEIANDTSKFDDENWRDKIDLRAVECCYDGVEYSTPPFPFVQRWDPQQRMGFGSSKSRRKAKNKKRKRNDSSYYENQYEDSFEDYGHTKSPRRQDYKPAAEEPAFYDKPIEDVRKPQQDSAQHSHDLQDAQAASNQLMHKAADDVQSIEMAMEHEDLPALSNELTAYPALKIEDCKAGAVIAFKKFEMSLMDGWQPYISEHRTAMVDCLNDDGLVEMTWARRDQPLQEEKYDRKTGERIYGKFEMREYEESKDSDASKVSVMFSELIDPILVRAAEDNPSGASPKGFAGLEKGDGDKMQESDVNTTSTEEPLPTKRQGSIEARKNIPEQSKSLSPKHDGQDKSSRALPDQTACNQVKSINALGTEGSNGTPINVPQPNTQDRQEISKLIKDAGWRSSFGPEIKQRLGLQNGVLEDTDTLKYDKTIPSDPPSPRFNGFSDLPAESHSNNGDRASPFSPAVKSSQPNIDEIAESLPPSPQQSSQPISPSKLDNSVSYHSLPAFDANDESDPFLNERQHRSFSLSASPSHERSPSSISPPSLRRQKSAQRGSSSLKPASHPMVKENANFNRSNSGTADDSSDEFPALFSQKFEERLSQDIESMKREASMISDPSFSNSAATKKRQAKTGKAKTTAKAKARSGGNGGDRPSSQRTSKDSQQIKQEQDESLMHFSYQLPQVTQSQTSQPQTGSQIIDLTQASSDPPEIPNDDEGHSSWNPSSVNVSISGEGSSLPRGSGWVSKKKRTAKRR